MPEGRADIVPFLKKIFLFAELGDERIERLAAEVDVVELQAGQVLYAQGDFADSFYIVWEGRMRLTSGRGRYKQELDTLIPGDYFGEDMLFERPRAKTANALEQTRVLRLERGILLAVSQEFPRVRALLTATARSRRLARQRSSKYRWMGDNETIYLIERKHEFFLLLYLTIPIVMGVLSFPVMVWGLAPAVPDWTTVIFGLVLLLFAILLGVWFYLDWENDHYVVTSQRVVWMEKIILLYDSRQEAPLSTILATNVVHNQVLRFIINYGTVIVRTYTGSILLRWASRPNLFIDFIKGLQSRARELEKQAEDRAMEALLRERLGLAPKREPEVPVIRPPVAVSTPALIAPRGLTGFFENFLKVRYQFGDVITYRKHWFVLLKSTWLPSLAIAFLLLTLIFMWPALGAIGLVLWGLVFFAVFLWWLYHYVDWRNDVYVVTRENILDIERKPLAREVRKSASLDNILSLENRREGILGLLLNFGTVIINVGIEQFNFYGVFNPAQVQFEVFDRMVALRRRREEAEAARQRERLADWLVMYHEQTELLERIENNSDEDRFSV